MTEEKPPPSLRDLETRLKKVREEREQPRPGRFVPSSRMGRALHLAIEMAASLAVGAGIGWFLDYWLGTKPWLLIVFVFLGIGASLRNAFRLAKQYQAELDKEEQPEEREAPGDEER